MTTRARRVPWRQIIVSFGILIQGAAAFKLSFEAQTLLAHAAGIPIADAWLYPFAVDAAIVTASLIVVWIPKAATRGIRAYLYGAIALWTAISVTGNAIHTTALPTGEVTVPLGIAIAVNTVPAVTLFLTIHLATTAPIYAADDAAPVASTTASARPRRSTTVAIPEPPQRATERAEPPIERLMHLVDVDRLSTAAIAAEVGWSKSWVAQRIADERRRRRELSEEAA